MAGSAGKAGGGGGQKTARSQNYARAQQQGTDYLRQYGYPSSRELRREAQGLAGAAVPTARSVSQPYQRQMQSTRAFLEAVRSALADTSAGVGQGYDSAIAQSQATDQAAQARLAGLGLGTDAAGTQAAVGARGDSASQNLIANAASAKNYAAQLPGIAAGQASVQNSTLSKNMLDALSNRRDQLSAAFFNALQQVQGQALQRASFNQSADQFQQQMGLQQAQFAYQKQQAAQARATAAQQFAQTMAAKYGYDVTTGKYIQGSGASGTSIKALERATGLTANEVQTLQAHTYTQVTGLLRQGYSWKKATQTAIDQGVNPIIAQMAVHAVYNNPPPLPGAPIYTNKGDPTYVPPPGADEAIVRAQMAKAGISSNNIDTYVATHFNPYYNTVQSIQQRLNEFHAYFTPSQMRTFARNLQTAINHVASQPGFGSSGSAPGGGGDYSGPGTLKTPYFDNHSGY